MLTDDRRTEDKALQQHLAHIIAEENGGPGGIERVERQASDYASSYASEVVVVRLSSGGERKFFLKNFGACRHVKQDMEVRRMRELCVYRDLLPGTTLGTARYYGSHRDADNGPWWLLLEFVEGLRVRYCDLEHWFGSVRWLGRMHAHFAPDAGRLSGLPFLQKLDADFFRAAAERARSVMFDLSAAWVDRLDAVLSRYDRIVPILVGPAQTLVHGSFGKTDVLIDATSQPPRICPVDWELAGYGNPVGDFAYFTDGFDAPVLQQMWESYRDAAGPGLALPEEPAEMRYMVDCFCLHRRINRLGQSIERRWAEDDIARMLDETEQLAERVLQ